MTAVAPTRCSACRTPTADLKAVRVAGRVIAVVCRTCEPKVQRGQRAVAAVALRGVGLAAERFFPKTYSFARAAYLTARDAWDKAEGETSR